MSQIQHSVQEAGDTAVDEYIPPPDYSASENLMSMPPGIP